MKHYETKTRKKRILAWCAALTFAVAGIVMSLAIFERIFIMIADAQALTDNADNPDNTDNTEDELVEYTWIPDETTELNYVNSEMELLAQDTFSCTLKNQIYSTSGISLVKGDELTVSVGVKPSDVYVKVGIVQPNGVWRYVYA